ncbi:MAG: XTP/dITP diphosphohydrolase [Verrucomicrobiota bacterium]
MDLLLATHNAHKTREFAAILGNEFHVRDLSSARNIPEIKETGHTFAENAILKALAVAQDRQVLVVADDSGLEVEALGGAPGIYSARYAGDNATDKDNVAKLLSELRRRNLPSHERSARFRCVLALARAGKLLGTFEGVAEGVIVDLARGTGGFGYDPIFVPEDFDKTFAELPAETKNRISHRAKAIASLRDHLARGSS